MPAYFNQGFFVREPAWHGLGVVLDDYPGRDEAMRLAGHDFDVVERSVAKSTDTEEGRTWGHIKGFKALTKSDDPSVVFGVVKDTYTVVQNSVGWDIVDAIIGEGARYETGLTLHDGAVCSVLAWLNEPIRIPGDDSDILPYLNVAWSHDGSGALTARSTSVRVVCANTQAAAEMQGKRLGTDYTFRHTRNVMDRVNEAKNAIQGLRKNMREYEELAIELASIRVSKTARDIFLERFIPMPEVAVITDRVAKNVDEARASVKAILELGATVPDAHRDTAYGLQLAGVEYLDHIRGTKGDAQKSKYNRSIMRAEPLKAKLISDIHAAVKIAA